MFCLNLLVLLDKMMDRQCRVRLLILGQCLEDTVLDFVGIQHQVHFVLTQDVVLVLLLPLDMFRTQWVSELEPSPTPFDTPLVCQPFLHTALPDNCFEMRVVFGSLEGLDSVISPPS